MKVHKIFFIFLIFLFFVSSTGYPQDFSILKLARFIGRLMISIRKIMKLFNFQRLQTFENQTGYKSIEKSINGTFFESWPIDYIWAIPSVKSQVARLSITAIIFAKIVILLFLGFLVFFVPVLFDLKDVYTQEDARESRMDSIFGHRYWNSEDDSTENRLYFRGSLN